jgi:hypothetical protein
LALQSENFTTTWAVGSLNITSGFTSPTNTNLGALIEASAAGGRLRQSVTLSSGATLDFSCFAKLGTLSSGVSLVFQDGTNTNYTSGACQAFRLDTGQLASSGSTGAGFTVVRSGIENYGNGWYRCNLAVTMGYTPATANIMIRPTASLTSSIPVSASGDTCYIFGAQVETGSIATSYIPTTTAAVTRTADVISVTGAVSGCIGQTEGTLYLDLSYGQVTSTATRWLELFGSSNHIGLAVGTAGLLRSIVNGQSDILAGTETSTRFKIAWSYNSSGVVCFVNGVQFTLTNGGAQTMTSLTGFKIDMSTLGGLRTFNNRINAFALYTSRLTNAELAALTTL